MQFISISIEDRYHETLKLDEVKATKLPSSKDGSSLSNITTSVTLGDVQAYDHINKNYQDTRSLVKKL
jgi:hypothetical protein